MKVWFIRHKATGMYLGVSIEGNSNAEFANSYIARLVTRGTPQPFASEEKATKVISEDTDWYNSSIEMPMRGDGVDPPEYTLDTCEIVGVELP